MKHFLILLTMCTTCFGISGKAASDTYMDYQNYNHGYCPDCNCYPCRCGGYAQLNALSPEEDEDLEAPPPLGSCGIAQPDEACAAACGTECGISPRALGVAAVAVAAATAIILLWNN